jgi:hypothetical protein
MNLFLSSFLLALIYLMVFVLTDYYYMNSMRKHVGELSMKEQYGLQFITVFVVSFFLGVSGVDSYLCSAH